MTKIKRALGDGATCCGGADENCDLDCTGKEKRDAAKAAKADAAAKEDAK